MRSSLECTEVIQISDKFGILMEKVCLTSMFRLPKASKNCIDVVQFRQLVSTCGNTNLSIIINTDYLYFHLAYSNMPQYCTNNLLSVLIL